MKSRVVDDNNELAITPDIFRRRKALPFWLLIHDDRTFGFFRLTCPIRSDLSVSLPERMPMGS